jgi:hypothetical protein
MNKIILTLFFPLFIFAQSGELGEVTIQELQEKQHALDSSAVAAVLFEKGKTVFYYNSNKGFSIETEVEVKIKIYKKDGYDWANKSIMYSSGSDSETVFFSKAITYNLVDGKIVKSKLSKDGEFLEKNNEFWTTKKITMPNVKEGSIIEYKYVVKSPFISKLDIWKFQSTIPVNYSEFVTFIPEYYNYNIYSRGFEKINKTEQIKVRNITYSVGKGQYASTSGGQVSNIEFNETETKYFVENLPAFKTEPFSNTYLNYLSSIEFELASTRFPNSAFEEYSQSWEDVSKTIYSNESFGKELNKDNYYEDDLKVILSQKFENENSKINVIFDFVKNKMKWDNFVGIYTNNGVKKAYQDKVGNVAEINFILISMLRSAGFDANPILLSTRDKAINLFPSRTAFNYVICGVEVDKKIIFLDATEKNATLNILPLRCRNYLGRIIRKTETSSEVDLASRIISKNIILCNAKITSDAKIEGNIKDINSATNAYLFRNGNASLSEDSYLEKIEKNNPGLEILDYKVFNKENLLEDVKEDYNFIHSNQVERIDGKLFFKPLLFYALDQNPFKTNNRTYPIDFIFPTNDSYTFTYSIPEGYDVENIPANISISMVDNISNFKFLAGKVGNKIQIVCNFNRNETFVSPDYYEDLKTFYNQVYIKMNEKIVLKKL